jgi:hypothetical protein
MLISRYGNQLTYLQEEVGSPERFRQFVANWASYPRAMRQGVDSLSQILPVLHQQKLSLSSYIPSLHQLHGEWPRFVQSTCEPTTVDQTTELTGMEKSGQPESSKDPFDTHQASLSVWREDGPIARALCILHVIDSACWDRGSPRCANKCTIKNGSWNLYGDTSTNDCSLP